MQGRISFSFILWLLVGSLQLGAQGLNSPSDLGDAFLSEPKVLVKFDSKRSFINKENSTFFGLRIGLNFENKISTGFGIYTLVSDYLHPTLPKTLSPEGDSTLPLLQFQYMSIWVEYMILETKRWELSVPLSIGFGDSRYRGYNATTYSSLLLAETSLEAQYKIVEWIGLGGGVGYRQIITARGRLRKDLSAPIYRFGVRFFLGYFYKKLFD